MNPFNETAPWRLLFGQNRHLLMPGLRPKNERRALAWIIAVGWIVCIAGCQPKGADTTPFGLKIVDLKILDASLKAEVADTPQASENGLMFRDSLPEDRGMLFVFEQPKTASFWMRNTRIPLSIAYIDSIGRILEIKSMKPLDETVIPSVSDQVAYALEVNQGWFGRHGIVPGAKIDGIPRK
jgi:uncharacterized membrane protein (UPF0127 family)